MYCACFCVTIAAIYEVSVFPKRMFGVPACLVCIYQQSTCKAGINTSSVTWNSWHPSCFLFLFVFLLVFVIVYGVGPLRCMLCCLADHLLFSALLPYLAFAGRGVFFCGRWSVLPARPVTPRPNLEQAGSTTLEQPFPSRLTRPTLLLDFQCLVGLLEQDLPILSRAPRHEITAVLPVLPLDQIPACLSKAAVIALLFRRLRTTVLDQRF